MPCEYTPSREAIAAALTYLANDPEYSQRKQEVTRLAQTNNAGFLGEASVINVLVEYARHCGAHRLNPLWAITDRKHMKAFPDNRKKTYQASYMAATRKRQRQAVMLYERLHNKTLSPKEKKAYRASINALWQLWRDDFVSGKRPGHELNEIVRLFWEDIENQLELGLAGDDTAARAVLGEANTP